MKKILLLLTFIICSPFANASVADKYGDYSLFFTNNTLPQSVAVNENNVSIENLKKLKCGKSESLNVLGLFDTGDAGINKAAKNGDISKIYYVDNHIEKINIPAWFINIYFKKNVTLVYGE